MERDDSPLDTLRTLPARLPGKVMLIARCSLFAALLAGGAAETAGQSCPEAGPTAFVNADVLTMTDSSVLRGRNVVIESGRITSISTAPPRAGICRIEARGRFLLPGLVDVHAHMAERELPLFLANGVTTVREMNGSATHIELRRRIAAGEVPGPRLVVASTLLVGSPLRYRHRLVRNPADARAAAEEARAGGYDFLKVYDELSREAYDALVASGRALGIRLDGHIPEAAGLERVLEAGQAIQHMDKISRALPRTSPDSVRLADARRLFAGRRAWVTPTLASLRILDRAGTAEYAARLERPEMAYVDSESVGWWRSLVRSGTRTATDSPVYRFQLALLRTLRESGARFLIGTDAANQMMIAGFSLHEEMQTLVRDGGFTTFEAIRAATRNAAEFLGDTTAGRVTVGAPADLVLADGNPLADVAALERPVGVMVRGRWFDRAALDRLLAASRVSTTR